MLNFIHKLHLLYLLKQKICEKAAAQRKTGKQTVANSKPADKSVNSYSKLQNSKTKPVISPSVSYGYYLLILM